MFACFYKESLVCYYIIQRFFCQSETKYNLFFYILVTVSSHIKALLMVHTVRTRSRSNRDVVVLNSKKPH